MSDSSVTFALNALANIIKKVATQNSGALTSTLILLRL